MIAAGTAILDERLSRNSSIPRQNCKGGEKTKSEWEELESLGKDELIIELIHWKNMYGIIRAEQDDSCQWPYIQPKGRIEDGWIRAGEKTTREWAERIAKYAAAHGEKSEFSPFDLLDYGMDEDQSYDVCEELHTKGELELPEGVDYRGGDDE